MKVLVTILRASEEERHSVLHPLCDKVQMIKWAVVASTEILALRTWRQKDEKFKTSLGYLQDHVSVKENQKNENTG